VSSKARRRVFIQTPLPTYGRTPLKGRISLSKVIYSYLYKEGEWGGLKLNYAAIKLCFIIAKYISYKSKFPLYIFMRKQLKETPYRAIHICRPEPILIYSSYLTVIGFFEHSKSGFNFCLSILITHLF